MLEYIILGFLMTKERSGYDLKRCMTQTTSYFFDASFGSIYPALKRLAQKGFVTFREDVDGGKFKKVYRITDSGRTAFMQWVGEPITFERSRQDHLVRVFFYEFLPRQTAIDNLKDLMLQVTRVAQGLTEQKGEMERRYDVHQFPYRYATLLYGVEYYDLVLRWCDDLIDDLKSDSATPRHAGHE